MPSDAQLENAVRRGHEGDDIREGWVAFTAISLAVLVPIILVLIWLQFKSLAGVRYKGLTVPTLQKGESVPTKVFPKPQLQTISGEQRRQFQARENKELNSYGWADGTHQFARIPIGRAMELIAERGLPVRATNVNSVGPSELELAKQRSQDKQLTPMKEPK
jgi:hypothetical protein